MKSPVGDKDQVVVAHLQRAQVVQILEHVVQQDDNLILADVQLRQVAEASEDTQRDQLQLVAAQPQCPHAVQVVEGPGLYCGDGVLAQLQVLQVGEVGKLVWVDGPNAILAEVQKTGVCWDALGDGHKLLAVTHDRALLKVALATGWAASGGGRQHGAKHQDQDGLPASHQEAVPSRFSSCHLTSYLQRHAEENTITTRKPN